MSIPSLFSFLITKNKCVQALECNAEDGFLLSRGAALECMHTLQLARPEERVAALTQRLHSCLRLATSATPTQRLLPAVALLALPPHLDAAAVQDRRARAPAEPHLGMGAGQGRGCGRQASGVVLVRAPLYQMQSAARPPFPLPSIPPGTAVTAKQADKGVVTSEGKPKTESQCWSSQALVSGSAAEGSRAQGHKLQ